MDKDSLSERGRALEEDYFRRRDQELMERLRQKAASEASQREMGAATGLNDPAVLQELSELGFTPDTVALLPLLPVLQVAWAEGGVTPGERTLIEKLANARGIAPGSPADAQLMDWLANRPSDTVFDGAARLIRAMFAAGGTAVANLSPADLVAYCEEVAAASGGFFGLGRISSEERELLASIATDLEGRRS